MRLQPGQKCSSTGAPAPQLRHSSIDAERTGMGSGVISQLAAGGLAAGSQNAAAAGCPLSGSKGAPAAAGLLRVRVVKHESLREERRVVIEGGALEEQVALAVDIELRAL